MWQFWAYAQYEIYATSWGGAGVRQFENGILGIKKVVQDLRLFLGVRSLENTAPV